MHPFMDSNEEMAKGKRNKRQRSPLPYYKVTVTSSFSSGYGGYHSDVDEHMQIISSPATSSIDEVYESSTEEEEDMANCLILLAQGDGPKQIYEDYIRPTNQENQEFSSSITKSRKCVYECQVCNRRFPSSQALGGHRASHKKPKVRGIDFINHDCRIGTGIAVTTDEKSCSNSNKVKVHECSICGSEFTSGQALGGHMRRHRANNNQVVDDMKPPTSTFGFDLNLPAPEDHDPNFQLVSSRKPSLVFSAPPLVDCHY